MMIYTLIEMVDIDIISVTPIIDRDDAERHFEAVARENDVSPIDKADWPTNHPDTLRAFAGDDAYSVELHASNI